ncbi:hypothetical protein BP6252_11234 [Coleophoma cylindrospora]|uniref:Zn(2)-C6 fungal-type domain-containing protein n=1 Tax=Coleophoma cylindrospora TaxID=1849047 RepID=A0A3D8QPF7_9HELO|nr:hypothetical protein BP6252_11234 [Coleophoma cylindrospora]
MSGTDISLAKRTRARGRKVKTGCHTCKARHVKCDEAKPACLKCSSSGRTCDGYGTVLVSLEEALAAVDSLPRPFRNKQERRCFEHFRHRAVPELLGYDRGPGFWNGLVLQLSQCSPAVMHAMLALSTLYEVLHTPTAKESTENGRLFLQQYNKAIRLLCSPQSTESVESILSCCILFICLENFRGNHEIALNHLRNGLKILHDWRLKEGLLASERSIQEVIVCIFRRLDIQATTFLDSRKPELDITLAFGGPTQPYCYSTESFANLHEAKICLDNILIRLLYTLTSVKSPRQHSPLPGQQNRMVSARRDVLQGLAAPLSQWKEAFDDIVMREESNMETKDLQLSVLLALHHQTMSLMLQIRVNESSDAQSQTVIDDAQFEKTIHLSKSLINSSSATQENSYAADSGVIAPLYFTAMNASNPHLRQQAIELLRLVKWKEGFWEAEVAATIAENILYIAQNGIKGIMVTGGIPELAKLHCF